MTSHGQLSVPQFPCLWKWGNRCTSQGARLGWGDASRALSGVSCAVSISKDAGRRSIAGREPGGSSLGVGEKGWRVGGASTLHLHHHTSRHFSGSSEQPCELGTFPFHS